jgi:hydrogenase maturation protease
MARVLILGYGNPLRSDDGVGWHAAVQLFRAIAVPEVEILPCHQLTPDLAENVSHAETVLFMDGAAQGVKAGEFHCEEVFALDASPSFTHHLDPGALLAIARDLYGAYPKAWLLTICGSCFDPGDSLSPEVESALRSLKARARELIAETIGDFAAAR